MTIPVDIKLKRKSEQEKTDGWESDKQLTGTLNDMTQSPQVVVAIGTKLALSKKDMPQWTVTGWVCNKERVNC